MDNSDLISSKLSQEKFVYSSEWIPDQQMRSLEVEKERLQEELDWLDGKKQHPSECRGCKIDDSFACIECSKRTFGLDYVPEQYYCWTAKEKLEWKMRMRGDHGGLRDSAVNAGSKKTKELKCGSKTQEGRDGRKHQIAFG